MLQRYPASVFIGAGYFVILSLVDSPNHPDACQPNRSAFVITGGVRGKRLHSGESSAVGWRLLRLPQAASGREVEQSDLSQRRMND